MEETELGHTRAATGPRRSASPGRLARGAALGRYLVTGVLGEGGMGVVYAAYDPELDRKLAIKLLHPAVEAGTHASVGRARLLREAQSLAKLQHANVVTVHDVGLHDDQVFVAMELVDGPTLAAWCQARRRTWREVVDVFVAAGHGLQAAHDKGLVHRDFKPDNVMLVLDGDDTRPARVVVMDFGLAQHGRDGPATAAVSRAASDSPASGDLTVTGAAMGTPAYMAPEQHLGVDVDARSDQFSFCVALYEALYGARPFAGSTRPELVSSVTGGRVEGAPAGSAVPRWLRDVVVRGLATLPSQRWPTMAALLEALGRDPTGRRRRVAALVVAAAAIATTAGALHLRERSRVAGCRSAADAIDALWNDGARARVEAGLLATGASYAPDTWQLLSPRIDAQIEAWRTARLHACMAPTEIERELHQAQSQCFEGRRQALADQLELLATADVPVLNRAIAMTSLDADEAPCRDELLLQREAVAFEAGTDPARYAELRRRLEQARLLEAAGRYDEALQLADAVVDEADALGLRRLAAMARARRGYALNAMARYAEAEREFEEAFFAALAAGDERVALSAATPLVAVTGANLGRRSDGLRWARYARILIDDVAELDGAPAAVLEANLGNVALEAGDYRLAIEHLERAHALQLRIYGDHDQRAIRALKALGSAYDRLHEFERARALLEHALALSEETFGPGHPEVANAHNDLGASQMTAKDLPAASAHFEQALAIYQASGLDERMATTLDNLAALGVGLGTFDEALAASDRALAIRERTEPPDSPTLGRTLINRGVILKRLGRVDEAARDYDRALAIFTASLGAEHELVGDIHYNRVSLLAAAGRFDEALDAALRGLAIFRRALGPRHPKVLQAAMNVALAANELKRYDMAIDELEPVLHGRGGAPLPQGAEAQAQVVLAEALWRTGAFARALAAATRGLELDGSVTFEPGQRALARFLQAAAAWEAGADPARARAGAADAHAALRASEQPDPAWLAEVEAWLRSHPAPARGATRDD